MSGPAASKIPIKGAKVYLHLKDAATGSRVMHIDVESPELNRIIKEKESTYAAGKHGGFFVGLKKEMIKRAERFADKK